MKTNILKRIPGRQVLGFRCKEIDESIRQKTKDCTVVVFDIETGKEKHRYSLRPIDPLESYSCRRVE